jgi:hypothetical protein
MHQVRTGHNPSSQQHKSTKQKKKQKKALTLRLAIFHAGSLISTLESNKTLLLASLTTKWDLEMFLACRFVFPFTLGFQRFSFLC